MIRSEVIFGLCMTRIFLHAPVKQRIYRLITLDGIERLIGFAFATHTYFPFLCQYFLGLD